MSHSDNKVFKWLMIGCGGCLILLIVAAIVIFIMGRGFVTSLEQGIKDPTVKAEGTKEVFDIVTIPEGLEPTFHLAIPFTFEAAMLSDQPFNPENGGFEEDPTQFIFQAQLKRMIARDNDFAMLKEDPPNWKRFGRNFGVRLKEQDYDGGGDLTTADQQALRWDRWTGDYTADSFSANMDGTTVVWRTVCESGEVVLGLWFKQWDYASEPDALNTPSEKAAIDQEINGWLRHLEGSTPCS